MTIDRTNTAFGIASKRLYPGRQLTNDAEVAAVIAAAQAIEHDLDGEGIPYWNES